MLPRRPARVRDGSDPRPGHPVEPPLTPGAVDSERLRQVADLVELVTGTPAAQVSADQRFVDDLRVDSLSMIEVLEGCELHLGVRVPDAVTRQLVHVGDLVDYLAHQGRRTPHS